MKKKPNYFKRLLNAILDRETEEVLPVDKQLVNFLKAVWCQKQLDDLLLMMHQVNQQMKAKPFHPPYIQKRNKCEHDINLLQPIVLQTGFAAARIIENEFGVQFSLLSGRALGEARKRPEVAPEPKNPEPPAPKDKSVEERAAKLGIEIKKQ